MQVFSNPKIKGAYQKAEAIMQERAVSFYQAFSELPEERFRAITAVYAFCRVADDIADSSTENMQAKEELLRLENLIEDTFVVINKTNLSSKANEDDLEQTAIEILEKLAINLYPELLDSATWYLAFIHTALKYNLQKQAFLDQIQGQKLDIKADKESFSEIKDQDEFIQYCRLVAGSVGAMIMPILIESENINPQMEKVCSDLGVGMQITNILRDVGEDIRERDRVYLPRDLREKFSVSKGTLYNLAYSESEKLEVPEKFKKLWEYISDQGDKYYIGIEDAIVDFIPEARLAVLSSAYIYHSIEDAVRENGYNCFNQRNYSSKTKRLQMLNLATNNLKERGL